jgi:hypothetical protein
MSLPNSWTDLAVRTKFDQSLVQYGTVQCTVQDYTTIELVLVIRSVHEFVTLVKSFVSEISDS